MTDKPTEFSGKFGKVTKVILIIFWICENFLCLSLNIPNSASLA